MGIGVIGFYFFLKVKVCYGKSPPRYVVIQAMRYDDVNGLLACGTVWTKSLDQSFVQAYFKVSVLRFG